MKKEIQFLKFDGERFDNHTLPVECAAELMAYARVVKLVATHLYKRDNPNKRLPKGFNDKGSLFIDKFQEGSTIAPVCVNTPDSLPFEESDESLRLAAAGKVNEWLQCIQQSKPLPEEAPVDFPSYFKSFGKTLNPDEVILMSLTNSFDHAEVVKYTKAFQEEILSIQELYLPRLVIVDCQIDSVKLSGKLLTIIKDRNEISVGYAREFEELIRDAHRHQEESHVRIYGRGTIDNEGKIVSISEIQHLVINSRGNEIHAPNSLNWLSEIQELSEGWLDGQSGGVYSKSDLDLANKLISYLLEEKLPSPYIYPSPDNELSIEWSLGTWDLVTTLDFEERAGYSIAVNSSNQKDTLKWDFSLDDIEMRESVLSSFNIILDKSKEVGA